MNNEFKVGDYFKYRDNYWQLIHFLPKDDSMGRARCLTEAKTAVIFFLYSEHHAPVTKVELNAFEKAVYGIET